jgi:AcrR family transcriptional regulator
MLDARVAAVGKGQLTRQAILDSALQLASRIGFAGLTISALADKVGMSKSGLFAHFGSKDDLQLATLEHARQRFIDVVITPSLDSPSGEPRLRAVFENSRRWNDVELNGGCIFIAASAELDDQPGPLRDALVRSEQDWLELLSKVTHSAVASGEFRDDLDIQQFAFEYHGLMLAHHYTSRLLLGETAAAERTSKALNRLFTDARPLVANS